MLEATHVLNQVIAGSCERCRLREAPDVLTVSLASAHPLPDAAEPALRAEYDGAAALAIEPESGYQLTLHVRCLPAALLLADLHHRLAPTRSHMAGCE